MNGFYAPHRQWHFSTLSESESGKPAGIPVRLAASRPRSFRSLCPRWDRRRTVALFSSATAALYLAKSERVRATRRLNSDLPTRYRLGQLDNFDRSLVEFGRLPCHTAHARVSISMLHMMRCQWTKDLMPHETLDISCKDQVLNLGGLPAYSVANQQGSRCLGLETLQQQNSVLCILISRDRWRGGGASKRMSLNTADLCAKTLIDKKRPIEGLSLSPLSARRLTGPPINAREELAWTNWAIYFLSACHVSPKHPLPSQARISNVRVTKLRYCIIHILATVACHGMCRYSTYLHTSRDPLGTLACLPLYLGQKPKSPFNFSY